MDWDGPGVRNYMDKFLLKDPKWAEAEGNRAQVWFRRKLQKYGFMIRDTVREDFGRGQQTGGEEI